MQNSTITSMNSRDPILLVNPDAELYRRFTPREAARIQSFPDEFLLNDSEPKSYKQIGNAVPPVFMWYVARQLQKAIAANSNLSEAEIAAFMTTHPAGAFSPAKPKQECIQLNFLDMLDFFEGVNTESMMVREDEPIAYGRYRAPMYPTEFHEKFYIARGNVFDVESFWADGVAAFVKGGFNNISASYDEFKSTPHEGVHVAEYLYNNPGTTDPTPENVNDLVAAALNSLVEKGAKVITMPPINIVGVKAKEKDALTAQAVVAWLKDNGEKINRLIIVDKEC